jgi:phosphoadenosine phosphosulfate reductase
LIKTALAFSGGKDSWACLWLNKDQLADILVVWIDTGKNYPEMLSTIELAKAICPNFVQVRVDREGQNAYHGIPSDVVPINWTHVGQSFTDNKPVMVQSYLNCCYENIGANLHDFCKRSGITHLIRGQRNDEGHKSSARDGSIVGGITYLQPIENWNSNQVLDFVALHMKLPDHFQFNHSSMDCYDCTAYATESQDRIAYTKRKYPDFYAEYSARNELLKSALRESLKEML